MKLLFTLMTAATVIATPGLHAFDFEVAGIERVPVRNGAPEMFHPVFSVDGKSLLVTSESFDGLGVLSLEDGTYRRVSSRSGAGYKFAQSADGSSIVLRDNNLAEQTLDLYTVDLASATEVCIATALPQTNTLTIRDGVVAFAEPLSASVRTWADPAMASPQAVKSVANIPLLTEEDLKPVLYVNGTRTVIDPILDATGQDMNYCWTSLSPDGQRMLFVAGNFAYTSRLDGSELVCLGAIHAPVWRDNATVIGMLDSDDGHFFTASDIVAADIASAQVMQLTPESDDIKMYPTVSPDGNRIAFHTTNGEVYIINLIEK